MAVIKFYMFNSSKGEGMKVTDTFQYFQCYDYQMLQCYVFSV